MKKLLLTGIAALLLATGTAHAYVHREFYRCGKYLVTSGNDMIRDHWSLLVERNGVWKMRALPRRLFRETHSNLYNSGGAITYYRRIKCSQTSLHDLPDGVGDAIYLPLPPPELAPPKEPPPGDHIQPPKGDGWEDIEK